MNFCSSAGDRLWFQSVPRISSKYWSVGFADSWFLDERTRLPTSASHCNPTGFIQIPDFGHAIRGDRLDSHLLGFIHVIGHEVQAD
jgi:hypothetical protein